MVQLLKKLDVDGARLGTGCDNPEIKGFMSQQILDPKLSSCEICWDICFTNICGCWSWQWCVFSQDLGFFSRSHFNDKSLTNHVWSACLVPPALTCQDPWSGHMVALLSTGEQTTITWELILLNWNLEITSMLRGTWGGWQFNWIQWS